jgi:glycosyltransferase involved in cell wall biosynthesis
MKIAYLANSFPNAIESYVMEEITALRAAGHRVLPCSARTPRTVPEDLNVWREQTLYLQACRGAALLCSVGLCAAKLPLLWPFLRRIISGRESFPQRMRAILHTSMGVYYALLLSGMGVEHIHVHHGYFSAWIAMVAARLLGITYSVTLHGSDLLLNASYLDVKLRQCALCFTVSEYNRQHIFQRYPNVPRHRVVLRRLGVDVAPAAHSDGGTSAFGQRFFVLCVGRLHPVKDHAFLIQACAELKHRGVDYVCFLAGDGPERQKLEYQIRALGLEREVKLLGQVAREDLEAIYPLVDLIVLTSKSEGIPLALMEAMAHGKPVLAPNITGVPELVIDRKTGFLYKAGSIEDFVIRFEFVRSSLPALGSLRRSARKHVNVHFNRNANLNKFAQVISKRLTRESRDANPVLQ